MNSPYTLLSSEEKVKELTNIVKDQEVILIPNSPNRKRWNSSKICLLRYIIIEVHQMKKLLM